jgi:hypothetical protein
MHELSWNKRNNSTTQHSWLQLTLTRIAVCLQCPAIFAQTLIRTNCIVAYLLTVVQGAGVSADADVGAFVDV